MKNLITIILIALVLLAALLPMYILQKRISFSQQVYAANPTEKYYCMLDTTNLQEKLHIDFESAKQKYAEMTKYLNNSISTRQSHAQFVPHNCEATDTVAIIIPIRDRDEHLHILLGHLHPILQKQLLRYSFC